MKQIPNLFTLLNLVCGFFAIIFILQTGQSIVYIDSEGYNQVDLPEKITWGALLIFAAAIIDFLDGFVARMFKATSEMGKQLDSLADVVSFGIAPGLILFQLLRISFAREEGGLETSMAWLAPAVIIPCAAAWRLAKFNLDSDQQFSFKGLPTPAAGLTIASLPLIIWFPVLEIQTYLVNFWVLYAFIFVLSYLMVSNLPMMSLKFKDFSFKNNISKVILALICIVSAILFQLLAVLITLVTYVILSLLFKNKTNLD
jgi:CDP-diacylglycerol--serine O-phosphatidyltransferase